MFTYAQGGAEFPTGGDFSSKISPRARLKC